MCETGGTGNRQRQKNMMGKDYAAKQMNLEREKEYLYWLCQIPGIGAISMARLWEHFRSFERIYNIEGMQFVSMGILSSKAGAYFDSWKGKLEEEKRHYQQLQEKGIRFVSVLDQEYPKRLTYIYDFPMALYVKGKMPVDHIPSAAVIGARNCTSYGRQVAKILGKRLGESGIQIISGMALGIDGAGHEGALEGNGCTFAVLGSGVDVCYPQRHWPLYCRIPENGGILSEFPLKTEALPRHFPMRNRIISGLADIIIVVEAKEKSGSLITADLGLEQGKEIFAVPGMITSSLSLGCNQLIRQGASVVTAIEDILEFFQINQKQNRNLDEKNENGLAKKEKMLYSCLDFHPKFLDQLVVESGLPVEEVMGILLELEWKGFLLQPASHYYVKKL